MRTLRARIAFTLWLVLIGSSLVRADRLVLVDGRTLEGEIREEDDATVTLEIRRGGSTLHQKVPKADIRTWYRLSTEGEPYATLPINGVIGQDITPQALRAGFGQARESGAKYVILAINSPGGQVGAMAEMVDDILAESRRTPVIAYVKQAYSAAAVIAMSCRKVYMTPDGAIGAVVPFRMTDNGPVEVDAKFRSAFQAKIRATAAMAEHADLIIRGMSELDLEILLVQVDGKPVLRTTGVGKPIKSKGQILSLTAHEADECGLSKIAASMSDLGTQVAGGPWHEVNRRPWNAVIDAVAAARQREEAGQLRAQRLAERKAIISRIKPEHDSLVRRLAEVDAKYYARKIDIDGLQRQYDVDVDFVQKDYDRQMTTAQDRSNSAAMNQAKITRDSRLAALQRKFNSSIATPQSEANTAALEKAAIEGRLKQLVALVPSDEP